MEFTKAAAAAISGGACGTVGATGTLIFCASAVSNPVVIFAAASGAMVGMYFGKDAKTIMGAILKGGISGFVTGAVVALLSVAWTKFMKSSSKPKSTRRKIPVKGKKGEKMRDVKITEGGGTKGVTLQCKSTPCEISGKDTMFDKITNPKHAFIKARDNETGHVEKFELAVVPDALAKLGEAIAMNMNPKGKPLKSKNDKGDLFYEVTIQGTGKKRKRTNKLLFKAVKGIIQGVADSYDGEPWGIRNCQTFVSEAIKAVTGIPADHLVTVLNAAWPLAKSALSVWKVAKPLLSVVAKSVCSLFF